MADMRELFARPIVYTLPGMDHVQVQTDIPYKVVDGQELHLDVYSPAEAAGTPLPAVIYVHGEASHEQLQLIRASGQYTGWGRLTAASGLIGVVFNHRFSEWFSTTVGVEDTRDAVAYVREHAAEFSIDADRLAVWTCSAGGPTAFPWLLRESPSWLRALVAHYSILDLRVAPMFGEPGPGEKQAYAMSPAAALAETTNAVPPILISKAGLDDPQLNESIDRFVNVALARNVTLDLMTHPPGHHAFDTLDDDARSREIIARTLAFLRTHLLRA
jgi:acetyl esterase/lipase